MTLSIKNYWNNNMKIERKWGKYEQFNYDTLFCSGWFWFSFELNQELFITLNNMFDAHFHPGYLKWNWHFRFVVIVVIIPCVSFRWPESIVKPKNGFDAATVTAHCKCFACDWLHFKCNFMFEWYVIGNVTGRLPTKCAAVRFSLSLSHCCFSIPSLPSFILFVENVLVQHVVSIKLTHTRCQSESDE